jgi:hypothetical protein
VVTVKILGLQYPERYVVRRLVMAVQRELSSKCVQLDLDIAEVTDPGEIGKYAFVLVLPTLVINEKVARPGQRGGHGLAPDRRRRKKNNSNLPSMTGREVFFWDEFC